MSECLIQAGRAGLPFVNGDIRFVSDGGELLLVVEMHDGDDVKVIRNNGRWRFPRGYLVSSHAVAAMIFKYQENPTNEEMLFMGEYVSGIGKLMDAAYQAINEGSAARIESSKENDRIKARLMADEVEKVRLQGFVHQPSTTPFVYLMRHTNGLTKIGFSTNPKAREKTLQAEDPRLSIVFQFVANQRVERRLHDIFASVRIRGEWFDLADRHVELIKFFLGNQAESAR